MNLFGRPIVFDSGVVAHVLLYRKVGKIYSRYDTLAEWLRR